MGSLGAQGSTGQLETAFSSLTHRGLWLGSISPLSLMSLDLRDISDVAKQAHLNQPSRKSRTHLLWHFP